HLATAAEATFFGNPAESFEPAAKDSAEQAVRCPTLIEIGAPRHQRQNVPHAEEEIVGERNEHARDRVPPAHTGELSANTLEPPACHPSQKRIRRKLRVAARQVGPTAGCERLGDVASPQNAAARLL